MSNDRRKGAAGDDEIGGAGEKAGALEDGAAADSENGQAFDEIREDGMLDDAAADAPAGGEDSLPRSAWREGPDEEAAPDSWLVLDDDDLLHRIETLGSEANADEPLLEVVASHRHFFIRQEAAKRVRDRRSLFAFEDDRHVGQILVRHLTRREDVTYLERLAIRCRHVEVRSAAQIQLARVWRWLDATQEPAQAPAAASSSATEGQAGRELAPIPAGLEVVQAPASTTAALARDGVDASLLGWAAHFLVEHAWGFLGTTATRELLRRTHAALAAAHPALSMFGVSEEAKVVQQAAAGARVPTAAVRALAAWMTAFRRAARQVAPEVEATSVRGCTALMADALRESGFYSACDELEEGETPPAD